MKIKRANINIEGIPAILWGENAERVYIYVHGKMGSKEEAEGFAEIADKAGFQVLSFDLAEHGERENIDYPNTVWNSIRDLNIIFDYANSRFQEINLYAVSIGAYYSLMAYSSQPIKNCLFVSPILDMEKLIQNMMIWSGVDETILSEKKLIETFFGETLDYDYFTFAKENPVTTWNPKTHILYGMKDNLTDFDSIMKFTKQFGCELSTWTDMEHYLHTKKDLVRLREWQEKSIVE